MEAIRDRGPTGVQGWRAGERCGEWGGCGSVHGGVDGGLERGEGWKIWGVGVGALGGLGHIGVGCWGALGAGVHRVWG